MSYVPCAVNSMLFYSYSTVDTNYGHTKFNYNTHMCYSAMFANGDVELICAGAHARMGTRGFSVIAKDRC